MPAATVSRARSTASFGSRPRRAGHCPRRMHSARRGHRQRGRSEARRGWEASRLLQASAANSSREIPRRQCPDGTTPLMPRFAEDDVRASARCSLLHVPPSGLRLDRDLATALAAWTSRSSWSPGSNDWVIAATSANAREKQGSPRRRSSASNQRRMDPPATRRLYRARAASRSRPPGGPAVALTRYCLRRYYDLSVMPARSAA
jgi:hypothetical protein